MNTRFKYIVSMFIIVAGTFSLAGYFFMSNVNSQENNGVDNDSEVALLRGQVDELRKELAKLRVANQTPISYPESHTNIDRDSVVPPPNTNNETNVPKPSSPLKNPPIAGNISHQPPTEAEEESYLQSVSNGYDNVLASEDLDQQWATSEETGFRDRLSNNAPPGTGLSSIACRSTLCRMELNHTSDDAKEELMSSLHSVVGPRRSQVFYRFVYNPDGTSSTVLYVSRDGQQLPDVSM